MKYVALYIFLEKSVYWMDKHMLSLLIVTYQFTECDQRIEKNFVACGSRDALLTEAASCYFTFPCSCLLLCCLPNYSVLLSPFYFIINISCLLFLIQTPLLSNNVIEGRSHGFVNFSRIEDLDKIIRMFLYQATLMFTVASYEYHIFTFHL